MAAALVAVASVGCGGGGEVQTSGGSTTDVTGGPGVCSPGASAPCLCSDGAMGAQVCGDAGDGFGECVCDGASSGTAPTSGSTSEASTSEASTSEASTSEASTSDASTGDRSTPVGEPCESSVECVSDACSDGFCCDAPCTGSCEVCAWDLGATEDGACTPAPFTSAASQACPESQTCAGEGAECVALCVDVELEPQPTMPADFVFVIDNSGSMSEEIQAVAQNINSNLDQQLELAGVDAQVVMVTRHGPTGVLSGPDYQLCVAPPLSGTVNCSGPPVEIADQFAHYSVSVSSLDGLCQALDTFGGPAGGGAADDYGLHPSGWQDVLRPEALKVFVPISDDGTGCEQGGVNYDDQDTAMGGESVAMAWASALLGLSAEQFGGPEDPRWVMHSIVGLTPNDDPNEPYGPQDPIVTGLCPSAPSPGTGYQALSRASGGLRFPVCEVGAYGVYFQAVVADTVERVTHDACDYALPTPPDGQTLDLNQTRGRLVLDGVEVEVDLVENLDACGMSETSFYVDGELARLCPEACAGLADVDEARFSLEAMCE